MLAGKPPAVIAFPLQDTPETLHGTVVNAVRHTGHTLYHSSLLKFMVEYPAGVLKASVAMEQRMGIRIGLNSLIKGLVNEWIIVSFAENIGHNTPVTEIQDGAQIELMYRKPSYHLNSVTSVSHFSFGFAAWN